MLIFGTNLGNIFDRITRMNNRKFKDSINRLRFTIAIIIQIFEDHKFCYFRAAH